MTSKRKPRRNTEIAARPSRLETVLFSIAALVALAGLADATYLTVAHLAGEHVACGGSKQCSEVLSSKYASLFGIPLAALGGVGYFATFSFATLVAFGYARLRRFLGWTVLAMFLGTLWLLYLQAFVIHAYCTFCLLSAACTFLIAGILLAVPPRRLESET